MYGIIRYISGDDIYMIPERTATELHYIVEVMLPGSSFEGLADAAAVMDAALHAAAGPVVDAPAPGGRVVYIYGTRPTKSQTERDGVILSRMGHEYTVLVEPALS
jgi:hypothetical protein